MWTPIRDDPVDCEFELDECTRMPDLGSENGDAIHAVLQDTHVKPSNAFIADIDASAIQSGAERYGCQPVRIDETGRLPYPDGFFDIVYSSSVIEHVTVPKCEVWTLKSGGEFRKRALARQRLFANEIQRLADSFSCRRQIGTS